MTATVKQGVDDVPKGWARVNLGNQEFFDLIMGQSPLSETYTTKKTGLPFLQGNADFGTIHPNPKIYCIEPMKVAEKDDVLISVRAPVGEVNIATERYCIGRGLGAIRPKDKQDSKYLYYYLNHNRHDLERISAGSTFKAITKEDLEKFPVTLPTSQEKQKILSILTTVDDAIQRLRKVTAETERLKAGVMQELMTKGIGHTEFKDTEIGRVPKEWDILDLKKIGGISTGKTPPTSIKSFWGGHIPFVTPTDINESKFVSSTERFITSDGANYTKYILPIYSILVVCIGSTIGKVGLTKISCSTNQQINGIICNEEKVDPNYVYYILAFKSKIIKLQSGTAAIPIIKKSQFEKIKIPVPNIDEQHQISSILSSIDHKLDLQHQRTAHYERLKQGLMNELLTGNRRVKVT